ncbi:MAG: DUF371 domain-containing protein [Methanoregulaceae archaeon]|nr:DUF371 domain-containing protein [Methanoregulaceae archaeon]
MKAEERICCRGHPLVSALHPTTFEVTKAEELTRAGDCIIGIRADKGAADLSGEFREVISLPGAILTTVLRCGGVEVEVSSRGGPGLTLTHPHDLVWRKSSFTCDRTVGVLSDTTARTLPRGLIEYLRDGAELEILMTASAP